MLIAARLPSPEPDDRERYRVVLPSDVSQVGHLVEVVAECCFGPDPVAGRAHFRVCTVVAEAVRAVARSADLVGRWGGDEFIVLGLGLAPSPDTFTQRVLEEIHRSGIDPAEWPGGVSIGAASVSQHQIDVNDLINQADHDMYTRRRARRGN